MHCRRPPMTSALIDRRLYVLWRHVGGSWPSLESRVRRAPGAAAKLAALRSLRTRFTRGEITLAERAPQAPQVEEALAWLSALTPRPMSGRAAPIDPTIAALDTGTLIARVGAASPGMPRREMQELLRRSSGATTALLNLLRDGARGDAALWAIVLLGELREARAVGPLIALLGAQAQHLAAAAAEALGTIGAPAVPALVAATIHGPHEQRLYAYGALAAIHTPDAFHHLEEGLATAPELADVIARALAQHARPDAVAAITAGARRAPRWMRAQFSAALGSLAAPSSPDPIDCDWRLRYRRLPALAWRHPPAWTTIAALAHRRHARGTPVALSAVGAHARLDPASGRCAVCDGRLWRPTGLPLCRHTAHTVIALQRALLDNWAGTARADAWSGLDDCDRVEIRLARVSDAARAHEVAHARQMIAISRATLYWIVAVGREHAPHRASPYFRTLAGDLHALYGVDDPSWRNTRARRARPQNYS
jgi:hypothetical protein